jgi:YegS/Rv2252/BmrU family lipid kinase
MRTQVILNPKASTKIDASFISNRIKELLGNEDCSLDLTKRPGEGAELASEAVAEGATRIIAVGGDGTVNEVINGIAGKDIPLAIIPAGCANDLATHLEIPRDIEQAIEVAVKGIERRIDLIKVNDRLVATVGGLGFGSEVALKTNKFKSESLFGKFAYSLLGSNIYTAYAIFQVLFRREIKARYKVTNGSIVHDLTLWNLFVSNQPSLGKNFRINPGALNDDGLMDTCLICELNSKIGQIKTLLAVMDGKHIGRNHITTATASHLEIECERPSKYFGDGELISYGSVFKIDIVPGAIGVIVPKACDPAKSCDHTHAENEMRDVVSGVM